MQSKPKLALKDRKRAEALQLRTACLEAPTSGVVITDRSGQIVWVNGAFTALTGYRLTRCSARIRASLNPGSMARRSIRVCGRQFLLGRSGAPRLSIDARTELFT